MSLRTPDLLFTAIAPAIWGSTYIVHHPIPAELLTDDGRDAAGVAGGFIAS
ncbi:drug/metabolite transporter [Escherichia coli]|nr:drug/metabolite transporter [Escherichia coli]